MKLTYIEWKKKYKYILFGLETIADEKTAEKMYEDAYDYGYSNGFEAGYDEAIEMYEK